MLQIKSILTSRLFSSNGICQSGWGQGETPPGIQTETSGFKGGMGGDSNWPASFQPVSL